MNKLILAPIAVIITAGAVGLVCQDDIHQLYIQNTIDSRLAVSDGQVSICGIQKKPKEDELSLISRAGDYFDVLTMMERTKSKYENVFADTSEIKELSNTIDTWGYATDEKLKENFLFYKKYNEDGVFDELLATARAQIKYRDENKNLDIEKLREDRSELRSALMEENKPEFMSYLKDEYTAASCITGNDEFLMAIDGWDRMLDGKELLDNQPNIFIEKNIERAKAPMKAFTEKFARLAMTSAKVDIVFGESTEPEAGVLNYSLVTNATYNGFSRTVNVICRGYASELPLVLGSATVGSCKITQKGKDSGKSIYFDQGAIVDFYDDSRVWDDVKKQVVETYVK